MTDERKMLHLRVLDGDGGERDVASVVRPSLHVVEPREAPAVQLGFSFAYLNPETILSLGYDGLGPERLREILCTYTPRYFIDLRVSASFNTGRLSRQLVGGLFREFRVQYFHMTELSNRFVGSSLDYSRTLEMYARSIVQAPQLSHLSEMVANGPVVLLSGVRKHEPSERMVLVHELRRKHRRMDVVICD